MSYDESDADRDRFYDEVAASIYPEHRERAIDEFTTECLQRFYLENPEVLRGPLRLLSEARSLLSEHASPALVFAVAATETGLKAALLRPIVCGLVHDDTLGDVLANLVTGPSFNLEKLEKLLVSVLKEHAGIDLISFKREKSSKTLRNEILEVQKCRNGVLHRAEVAIRESADLALAARGESMKAAKRVRWIARTEQ